MTDMSVFKNHGTAIPVAIRFFFGAENYKRGQHRHVTLKLDNMEYPANLGKIDSKANQVRLMWGSDLTKAFNMKYPNALKTGMYPKLLVEKIDESTYRLEFGESFHKGVSLETVSDDLETEDKVTCIANEEGKVRTVIGTKYERDPRNRTEAIRIHGLKCAVCGFDFGETYGKAGQNYIEVHHIVPLCEKTEAAKVNPETDLVCVCSNCHRMIHRRKNIVYSVEELRKLMIESGSLREIDGQLIMYRKMDIEK